ncbi:hypothetical protein pb186bvf_014951 [Paramecium bursaria]
MSEEAEIQCQQCGTVPDNYVRLDCDHKFCLICLAYNYLQNQHISEVESLSTCSVCNRNTTLDNDTVEALRFVIQNIILPMLQQQQEETVVHEEQNEDQQEPIREQVKEMQQSQVQSDIQVGLKISQVLLSNNRNERIQSYIDRLDKSFKTKFELIKEIQDSRNQFQNKCQQLKEEINLSFQQFLIGIEQKRNQLMNDINSVEMVQLLEIQKQENLFEQQIKQMGKYQEDLQKMKMKSIDNAEINDYLLEVEKVISVSGLSFQIKSQIQNAQRSLQRIQGQASSYLVQPKENVEQSVRESSDHFQRERPVNLREYQVPPPARQRDNTQFSQVEEGKITPQYDRSTPHYDYEPKSNLNFERSLERSNKYSPKQERIQDIWSRLNDSGSKKKVQLQESQLSIKHSNGKGKWKDALFEIFDKRIEPPQQIEGRQKQTKPYNIHHVLTLQQQSFMQQKEQLLKR